MDFKISKDDAGLTVLAFLKRKLKISNSALTSLKQKELGICANQEHVTVRYILRENDLLTINEKDSFDDVNEAVKPHELPLNIILETDELFIIDKPPFMPTHPSHNHTDDTVANALAHIYRERNEPLVFRPIGRLDRNTSGLSLIAKNVISASFLHNARSNGLMGKRYIALLEGCLSKDTQWNKTETYMKRMEDSVIVRCVGDSDDPNAFIATTLWRVIWANENVSLVEAIPITGRTHQLRVHFAHLGHAILGDDIYGNESEHISRHALHAYSLTIPMPYDGESVTFVSMPPIDMQNCFRSLTGKELTEEIKNIRNKDGNE